MNIIFNKDGSFNDELTRFLLTADDGGDDGNEDGGTGGGGTGDDGAGTSGEGGAAGEGGRGNTGTGEGLMSSATGGEAEGNEGDIDLTGADQTGDTGRADLDPGTRPEGLADQFWNDETKEVRIPELAKSYNEAAKQQAKLANEVKELKEAKGIAETPKTAEAYLEAEGLFSEDGDFILPEGTDRVRAFPADDPALAVFAEIAHKHAFTEKQFHGALGDFLTKMNPMLPEPLNEAAEMEALGEGGKGLVQANRTWADGLLKSGQINAIGHGLAVSMGATAEGVKLINQFRALSGEAEIPLGPTEEGGTQVTKEEWYANTPSRDDKPAVWAEWEAQGKELFGEAPAGTSPAGMGMPSSRSGVSSPKTTKP